MDENQFKILHPCQLQSRCWLIQNQPFTLYLCGTIKNNCVELVSSIQLYEPLTGNIYKINKNVKLQIKNENFDDIIGKDFDIENDVDGIVVYTGKKGNEFIMREVIFIVDAQVLSKIDLKSCNIIDRALRKGKLIKQKSNNFPSREDIVTMIENKKCDITKKICNYDNK